VLNVSREGNHDNHESLAGPSGCQVTFSEPSGDCEPSTDAQGHDFQERDSPGVAFFGVGDKVKDGKKKKRSSSLRKTHKRTDDEEDFDFIDKFKLLWHDKGHRKKKSLKAKLQEKIEGSEEKKSADKKEKSEDKEPKKAKSEDKKEDKKERHKSNEKEKDHKTVGDDETPTQSGTPSDEPPSIDLDKEYENLHAVLYKTVLNGKEAATSEENLELLKSVVGGAPKDEHKMMVRKKRKALSMLEKKFDDQDNQKLQESLLDASRNTTRFLVVDNQMRRNNNFDARKEYEKVVIRKRAKRPPKSDDKTKPDAEKVQEEEEEIVIYVEKGIQVDPDDYRQLVMCFKRLNIPISYVDEFINYGWHSLDQMTHHLSKSALDEMNIRKGYQVKILEMINAAKKEEELKRRRERVERHRALKSKSKRRPKKPLTKKF